METLATFGFEISALLAPELAGTAVAAGRGPQAESNSPAPDPAPFALALVSAAAAQPQAAMPPASGNTLPLTELTLVAAQAVDRLLPPAPAAHVLDVPSSAVATSASGVVQDTDLPAVTQMPIPVRSGPIVQGSDGGVSGATAQSIMAEPASIRAAVAAILGDDADLQLAPKEPGPNAQIGRLATSDPASQSDEPAPVMFARRSGDRAAAGHDSAQPESPRLADLEIVQRTPSAVAAAVSATTPAATALARDLHRLESGMRAAEPVSSFATVTTIATEGAAAQPIDGAKLLAALPAGNEARLPSALAERVHWLIDQNLGEARIKLNPPQLGAVDIKITVADDRTFVHFTASQSAARDVLESALPRLRDLLEGAGLELGGATVGGEATHREQPAVRWSSLPGLEPVDATESSVVPARAADGRIDIYA